MTIYSLYIFDRHCTCVYYQDWHRTVRPKTTVEGGMLPAVYAPVYPAAKPDSLYGNRGSLALSSGVVVAVNDDDAQAAHPTQTHSPIAPLPPPPTASLSFDEEAKLVYGVVLSLRNMIKKLSGNCGQSNTTKNSTEFSSPPE